MRQVGVIRSNGFDLMVDSNWFWAILFSKGATETSRLYLVEAIPIRVINNELHTQFESSEYSFCFSPFLFGDFNSLETATAESIEGNINYWNEKESWEQHGRYLQVDWGERVRIEQHPLCKAYLLAFSNEFKLCNIALNSDISKPNMKVSLVLLPHISIRSIIT